MSKYSISIIAQYTIYEMYASHGLANSDELFAVCTVLITVSKIAIIQNY